MRMRKVVLDTNVIISAILFGGKAKQILEEVIKGKIEGYISREIIGEVVRVLKMKFGFNDKQLKRTERLLLEAFRLVEPEVEFNEIKNCPADNRIVECAIEAEADYLISGDNKHILPLKRVKGIKVVGVGEFIKE